MGVADRARKRMPTGGDYLDKDDLIRNQDEPFGVTSVVYDEKGSNFGSRWVLSLIPWFDDQEDPHGLLTFTANPTRNPFFEDLQAQLEENGNEPLGPLTLIKGKSQKGYRYYTLDDWTEAGPATGPDGSAATTPAQARPQRPAAPATEPEPTKEVPVEQVPDNPPARKRGRPRKNSETPSSATISPSASQTSPLPAAREPGPGEAARAQEVVAPRYAKATCPDCRQEVEGRVLPDDHGKLFLIHPFCPALNKGTIIEVAA